MAVWQPGSGFITVTSPQGRSWDYLVTPDGDRPLRSFLHSTPWCAYPGSEWREQPPAGLPGAGLAWDWGIAVYPESLAAARDLGIPWPLD